MVQDSGASRRRTVHLRKDRADLSRLEIYDVFVDEKMIKRRLLPDILLLGSDCITLANTGLKRIH